MAHPMPNSDTPRGDDAGGGSSSARTEAGARNEATLSDGGARKRVAELGVGDFALRAPRRVPLPECLTTCCADWPPNILRRWVEVQLCYRRLAEEKAGLASEILSLQRELQRSKSLEMSGDVHEELVALRAATQEQAMMLHAQDDARSLLEEQSSALRAERDVETRRAEALQSWVEELRGRIEELAAAKGKAAVGSKLLLGKHEASFRRSKQDYEARERQSRREFEQQKAASKKHSLRLMEQNFERQREALERAQEAERQLCASRLIQRCQRARVARQMSRNDELARKLNYQAAEAENAKLLNEAAATLESLEEKRAVRLTKDAATLKMRGRDGREQPLVAYMRGAMFSLMRKANHHEGEGLAHASQSTGALEGGASPAGRTDTSKFFGGGDQGIRSLTVGRPDLAALGLEAYLNIEPAELHERMTRGVEAIRSEVEASGDEEAIECLEYVLHQRAGSSPKLFSNAEHARDCDEDGVRSDRLAADGRGMLLSDFLAHPSARKAELSEAHIVALRLYSTAAFKCINAPLRDHTSTSTYPLAATVSYLSEGIKRLRAVDAENRPLDLWRGSLLSS